MPAVFAVPSLPAILLAISIVFLGGILLKKFKWHDCFALLAFFVLMLFPATLPLTAVLFIFLWFFPEKESVGKRSTAELAAILLTIVLLAAALAGSTYIQRNDGTIETSSGVLEALVVIATAVSSVSLYTKRSFRNYAANALISLLALWVYWWFFTMYLGLALEDIQMGLFKATGFTLMAHLILLVLVIRAALIIYLAAMAWRNGANAH